MLILAGVLVGVLLVFWLADVLDWGRFPDPKIVVVVPTRDARCDGCGRRLDEHADFAACASKTLSAE